LAVIRFWIGSRGNETVLLALRPIVRQEWFELLGGGFVTQSVKGGQHVPQVGRRVEAQVPTGAHHREVNRGSLTRLRAAHELPIAPPHGYQPERSLRQVIVQRQPPVFGVCPG
jgi:hypothetical protein